jgi:hypothetical protein
MSGSANVADFEPGQILRALEAHHVRYVVIGAIAAVAAGAPILTTDLDVTPDPAAANLNRLEYALRDLGATSDGVSSVDLNSLTRVGTNAGDLGVIFVPAGTRGFEDLRRGASDLRIAGVTVPVAALADVIRSKEAAGREKDSMQLPILRRTLEQIRDRG